MIAVVLAAGRYLSWGVVSISLTNLVVLVAMVVTFVLALVVPFPGARRPPDPETAPEERRDDS